MPALIESPPNPISLSDVAEISRALADDLSKLQFRTEGFTEDDYLALDGSYLVEYVDGSLQVLPMPDAIHQTLAFILCALLKDFAKNIDPHGRALMAPFKVKLRDGQFREPDVTYMRGLNSERRQRKFWIGADLVIEIISESNREHDWVTKRREYALNGIPEYWIIDPDHRLLTIFALKDSEYQIAGEFRDGQRATSRLLAGFEVDVTRLFDDAAATA